MKVYIFMRRDLKMRRGKEIAQACHAVLGLSEDNNLNGLPVITFQAESLYELHVIKVDARQKGYPWYTVRDAGRTEIPEGTATCLAVLGGGDAFPRWTLY